MKLALLAVVLTACQTTPAPQPPPNTAARVWSELVESGCLEPSDGGVVAIEEEHRLGVDPWLTCMFDGGTVKGCGAPCGDH